MIDSFWTREKNNGQFSCRTTGCSCCSYSFDDPEKDKEEILTELVENVELLDEVLLHYGMTLRQFRNKYMKENK